MPWLRLGRRLATGGAIWYGSNESRRVSLAVSGLPPEEIRALAQGSRAAAVANAAGWAQTAPGVDIGVPGVWWFRGSAEISGDGSVLLARPIAAVARTGMAAWRGGDVEVLGLNGGCVVLLDERTGASRELSVFQGSYSAGKVRFWLQHWLELATLEEDWATSSDLALGVAHEWELLRSRHLETWRPAGERWASCLCQELHDRGTEALPLVRGSGRIGDARALVRGIAADLLLAAEDLPVPWRATRKVFVQQQRGTAWLARFHQWRTGRRRRSLDGLGEPPGSYVVATRAMAARLSGGEVEVASILRAPDSQDSA